jgi:hypothetical protein
LGPSSDPDFPESPFPEVDCEVVDLPEVDCEVVDLPEVDCEVVDFPVVLPVLGRVPPLSSPGSDVLLDLGVRV